MPGVPPDAVEKVKGLLKGMFRRGKKSKTQTPPQQQQQSEQSASAALPPPPPPPAPANVAPSTSTYTTTSTPADHASPPNTNKQLPSTHDKAQPAIPVEKPAQPEAAPAPAVKEDSNIHAVSAASATPAVPPAPSAEFESDPAPAVPPKNDGVADTAKPVASSANHEGVSPMSTSPAVESATPAAPTLLDSTPEATPPVVSAPTATTAVAHSDEKMPVESEALPTPTKPVTSNEMSATSGPLPDFPQGEAAK